MTDVLRPAALFVATVVVLVGAVVVAAAVVTQPPANVEETTGPSYDADEIRSTPAPANGSVSVNVEGEGTVLIDDGHSNEFEPEDLQVLETALTRDGHDVAYVGSRDDLEARLANASAYVVVYPRQEFSEENADAVEAFAEGGGRVLIAAEPNRGEVQQAEMFQPELVTVRSEADSLGERFEMQFGADYLYNMMENDGNYRNVYAEPAGDVAVPSVDRTTVYTATHVQSPTGTPVLVASEGTRSSLDEDAGEYVVAARNGPVLGLGDASFMFGETHAVADNEAYIEAIARFLLTGSFDGDELATVDYEPDLGDDEDADDESDAGPAEDDNESEEVDIDDPTPDEPDDADNSTSNETSDEDDSTDDGDESPDDTDESPDDTDAGSIRERIDGGTPGALTRS